MGMPRDLLDAGVKVVAGLFPRGPEPVHDDPREPDDAAASAPGSGMASRSEADAEKDRCLDCNGTGASSSADGYAAQCDRCGGTGRC